MKLIRIDNDVWKVLRASAIPLEDNPNSVLRRLLGIDGRKPSRRGKKRLLKNSGRTDQSTFATPILEVLKELGGRAEVKEVMRHLETKMKSRLKSVDFEKLKSGQVRWKNTAQWARNELVSDGLLAKDSPRGIWALAEAGKDHLKRQNVRENTATIAQV